MCDKFCAQASLVQEERCSLAIQFNSIQFYLTYTKYYVHKVTKIGFAIIIFDKIEEGKSKFDISCYSVKFGRPK